MEVLLRIYEDIVLKSCFKFSLLTGLWRSTLEMKSFSTSLISGWASEYSLWLVISSSLRTDRQASTSLSKFTFSSILMLMSVIITTKCSEPSAKIHQKLLVNSPTTEACLEKLPTLPLAMTTSLLVPSLPSTAVLLTMVPSLALRKSSHQKLRFSLVIRKQTTRATA